MGSALKKEDAITELWRRGHVAWKLHSTQSELYQQFLALDDGKKFVINCSRRIGKTFFLVTIALEQGFKKSHSMIRMAAPTSKALRKIVLPIFRVILNDCPDQFKPEFIKSENLFRFPNGSEIHLAGCDKGHEEDLRGTSADLCIVDEAGFVDNLDYVVKDILTPQLMYNPSGRIIIASTPPKSPAHDFIQYLIEAEMKGYYAHRTIYDNPLITEDTIEEYAEEAGGKESTTWKREYLAQVVTEETSAVVPEFKDDLEKKIVRDWRKPAHFHRFTVGDTGFKDATAFLFGYYDFKHAKVVIEDEIILHGKSSSEIARAIKEKETNLWGKVEPYQRFADADLIVLQDISKEHSLMINPVKKDALEAQVNCLRLDVMQERIVINPRCVTTIAHLKYGIWDKARKKFDRSGEFYHFDALAALIYFVRHVAREANPYPWDYKISDDTHFIPDEVRNPEHKEWKKIFAGRA